MWCSGYNTDYTPTLNHEQCEHFSLQRNNEKSNFDPSDTYISFESTSGLIIHSNPRVNDNITIPNNNPTKTPTNNHSQFPTRTRTNILASSTVNPSISPSITPTTSSNNPTQSPTNNKSVTPTNNPKSHPTDAPIACGSPTNKSKNTEQKQSSHKPATMSTGGSVGGNDRNSHSGPNTCGTATPNSIIMSRSSSCGSVINGSECSFDDNAIDDNEFGVSSGASTPIITDSSDVNIINNTNYIISEDEMETPVPNSSDNLIDNQTLNDTNNDNSPFDFTGRNGFGLAQISEDVEHETIINTPNTAVTTGICD